jgi:hypothetical protein
MSYHPGDSSGKESVTCRLAMIRFKRSCGFSFSKSFSIWLVVLILSLTACGTPPLATPSSQPEAITLSYPPSLRPFASSLAACARFQPEIALYLNETYLPVVPSTNQEIVLRTGDLTGEPSGIFASLLTKEYIVLIVNTSNQMDSLSHQEIQALFTGQEINSISSGQDQSIQVWVLPLGDDARTIFDEVFIGGERISSQALVAPDPQAMLDAISTDPHAIGYVPASWLNSTLETKVKPIQIEDSLSELLSAPILALTKTEPQGVIRVLLLCLSGQN